MNIALSFNSLSMVSVIALLLSGSAVFVDASEIATKQHRVVHFPDGKSIGVVFIAKSHPEGGRFTEHRQISGAKGTVAIDLAPGEVVVFEANRRVFENPSCLNDVSAQGIDGLKLSAISLSDREDGMCDMALSYAKHFQGLKELNVDRSEATDAGLSKLKDIKSLTAVTAFLSSVAGASFKELSELPLLKTLDVPKCSIEQTALRYLPEFPKLEVLNMASTGLDETGAKYLGRCSNLRYLSVRGNAHFNDNGLKYLHTLKKLDCLDCRETAVTASGVVAFLRDSNIQLIKIPLQLSGQISEIQKKYPRVQIFVHPLEKNVSHQEREIYAPLR